MRRSFKILSLAAAYALLAKAGLLFASVNASATAVWPAAGLAFTVLFMDGYDLWPGVFLGAFIANLTTAGTIVTSLGIATGDTLEGLLAAYAVRHFAGGRHVFDHPANIYKYAALAALGSTMVAATIGVITLVLTGFAARENFGTIWLTWWLGDAGGIFLTAPVLILWLVNPRLKRLRQTAWETGLIMLILLILGVLVFGKISYASRIHYPLEFLCTPVVLWAAFRLGKRLTATLTFLLSVLAIWGTLHGLGPFARWSQNDSLLLLQTYMGVISIMSLAVAAVVSEREHALQTSEIRFTRLMESNVIGIITMDSEGRILEANETFLAMVGYSRDEMLEGLLHDRQLTPIEYEAQREWALEQLRWRASCPALEKEFIHCNGTRIPVLVGGVRLQESPWRAVYFVIDATHRRQAMEALRQAYDEIEVRVAKRTEELSEVNFELSKEIARRQQAEAELRSLSLQDSLTGLYNRRGFLALAEQQWLQAYRDKRSLILFFGDLDGLKQINDTLGHQRGDQALLEAANALRQTFRKSDILARIGGDEFAIVAAQAPLEQAQVYLSRLQQTIDQVNSSGHLPFKLSISIGTAIYDQKGETSVQELMRQADQDLYAHKHSRTAS